MKLSDAPVTESQVVVLPWGTMPAELPIASQRLKRLLDVSLCALAAFVCAPIISFCCLLIVLESPGSPIYRQRRIGMNGKVFSILKLRTMIADSDKGSFEDQDIDSRVTTVGRFLRKTKIDELPQILNILAGEMSIIGPRPLSVDECNYIEETLGFVREYPGFYPTVKPGLIGLEQVNRSRELTYAERFDLNYQYECSASLLVDMQIFAEAFRQCQQVCWLAFLTGMVEFVFATIQYCM